MTIRQVTPAGGAASVSFGWDLAEVILAAGELVDVEPGSDFEVAAGAVNLPAATAQQLASASNGGGGVGAVSN
jgi:hypothetical protein